MGGLLDTVGDAIAGLVRGLFDAARGLVQGAFGAVTDVLPFPLFLMVAFVGLAIVAWVLARR
jgi:hypothetical protein